MMAFRAESGAILEHRSQHGAAELSLHRAFAMILVEKAEAAELPGVGISPKQSQEKERQKEAACQT
jgi:hypothetical protein